MSAKLVHTVRNRISLRNTAITALTSHFRAALGALLTAALLLLALTLASTDSQAEAQSIGSDTPTISDTAPTYTSTVFAQADPCHVYLDDRDPRNVYRTPTPPPGNPAHWFTVENVTNAGKTVELRMFGGGSAHMLNHQNLNTPEWRGAPDDAIGNWPGAWRPCPIGGCYKYEYKICNDERTSQNVRWPRATKWTLSDSAIAPGSNGPYEGTILIDSFSSPDDFYTITFDVDTPTPAPTVPPTHTTTATATPTPTAESGCSVAPLGGA